MAEVPVLKYGYIKYNTRHIPQFMKEGELTSESYIHGPFYIKSEIPVNLNIGGIKFVLESGEHYIPKYHTFSELYIKTDLSNPNIKVYKDCVETVEHFRCVNQTFNYTICIDSIHSDVDTHTVFINGMSYTLSHDKLISHILRNSNDIDMGEDFLWLRIYDVETFIQKDKNKYMYFDYIYSCDIAKVQKDTEVTQYFVNWDKDFIRLSFPPCIAIVYTEENYEPLKNILKEKYNISITKIKPTKTTVRTIKSYEDICANIAEHYNVLDEGFRRNIYELVTLKEIPFTRDLYEKLKEKYPGNKKLPEDEFVLIERNSTIK